MQDQHIASAYDRDLEGIQSMIIRMGGLVEAAIVEGTRSLETRDVHLAEQVRAGDKAIDALEEQINEECARVIALRAPVSKDLRIILTTIKLASSLERVGDYAKNIAKRTTVLAELRPISGTESALRRMAREVEGMLKDTLDAYIARDGDKALAVIERDEEVDELYNALFREVLTHMMEDPRNITSCMHLHFIAKNMERMGDLVTNMSEQIVYLTTGAHPEESRTKLDQTAFVSSPDA